MNNLEESEYWRKQSIIQWEKALGLIKLSTEMMNISERLAKLEEDDDAR